MVFYRKYRPQKISELDLEEVRNRLESILKTKDLPHAFLFTGPKGLGKTSAARILAKAINCENNLKHKTKNEKQKAKEKSFKSSVLGSEGIEPCNKCEACMSITNGSNLDVLEIDAASNRGIDEIRDLREKIKFSPSTLKKKVYIIDEVHMLTQDAFNALLKTLEEPPSHAVFILCTTEEEKIPPTISSRTFHVAFKKPKKEEVVRSILRIIVGEKLEVEENVIEDIHRLSEGSFRDAAKILEELTFAAGNKKITEKEVEQIYKVASINQEVEKLIAALAKKDVKIAIGVIEGLSQGGANFKIVTEKIAEVLHDVLLTRAGVEGETFNLPGFDDRDLERLLGMINQSYKDIKFSILPQIPLELVVVEWCLSQDKISNIKNQISQPKAGPPLVENFKYKKEKDKEVRVETEKAESSTDEKKHRDLFRKNALPEDFFAALINTVKRDNHSIAGILRGCRLVELNGDTVRFETAFKFHRDKLNEAKVKDVLDKRSSEILNRNVHVVVNLVEK